MSVSTALVSQYYQGILRLDPANAEEEILRLSNLPDLSSVISSLLGTASTSVDPIVRMYQAAFGRVPDPQGLNDMVAIFANNAQQSGTFTLEQIASQFTGSPEFVGLYGRDTTDNASNEVFVRSLYMNILNRQPDSKGFQEWVDYLNGGGSRATTLWGFSESVEYKAVTNEALDNFLTSAGALTNSYAGNLFYYGGTDAAHTYDLKFGTDVISAGDGYNVFEAGLVNNGAGQLVNSLDNSDRITGGIGQNTINIVLQSGSSVTPSQLNSIQNINLSNNDSGSGAATLSLVNANAVSAISLNDLEVAQTVSGIQSASTQFALNNLNQSVLLNVSAAALVGDNDTAFVIAKGLTDGAAVDFGPGYEAIRIKSDRLNSDTTGNAIATSFDGSITLFDDGENQGGATSTVLTGETAGSTVALTSTNIDSTGLTGDLLAYLADSTTFVGGDGDTTLVAGGGVNSFEFGNGNNILEISSLATISNATTIQGGTGVGVDTLEMTAAAVGGDGNFDTITNFETFKLFGTGGTNGVTIGQNFVDAGFTTITGSSTNDIIVASNVALTDLTFVGGAESDTFTFSNTASGTVTIDQVETVNMGDDGGSAERIVEIVSNTSTVSVTLGAGEDTVNLLSNDEVSLTISGVENVNASSSTTGNTVTLANDSTVVTITGGDGNLTINANAAVTAQNSFIFGDAAVNTLKVNDFASISNATTIQGGTGVGVDTLEMTAAAVGGDGNFDTITNFETFKLFGTGGTNGVTIGQNFVDAGFTTITGSSTNDIIVASNVALTDLTFVGGAESDTFTFSNTASGTVTIDQVETVNMGDDGGSAERIVEIVSNTSTVSVTLGAGEDTVNLLSNDEVSLTISGVENVNASSSTTGNTVTLANDSTVVTITGGDGNLTINANAAVTAQNSFIFGDAAVNTLKVNDFASISNATTIQGGTGVGVDTLEMTAAAVGGDGNFDTITNFETFKLFGTGGTNGVTIGQNFVDAGFTTITGSSTNDIIVASNVALTDLTFVGGAESDTFTFSNTASGTVTIDNVENVTQGSNEGNALQEVIIAQSATTLTVDIDLGGGSGDSVQNNRTATTTVTLRNVEEYDGSVLTDRVTLATGGLITVNGGGGTDSVTLSVNTSNATVLAGSGAAMTVNGNLSATTDALVIGAAGTYNITSVETVTVSGGENATINSWLFTDNGLSAAAGTGGVTVLSTYNLDDNNIANFTLASGVEVTGGSIYLTVNAAENGAIDFARGATALIKDLTAGVVVTTQDVGYTTIDLVGSDAYKEVVTVDLGGLTLGSLSTADSIVVSSFGSKDDIDLSGLTLVSGNNTPKVLQETYLDANGFQAEDSFSGVFVSGNSTTLANISTLANQNGMIFQFNTGTTSANFTTQAGIDVAVDYIIDNLTTSSGSLQKVVLAVDSAGITDTGNALFLFVSDGVAGITESELSLIGVVSGTLSVNSFN